MISQQGDFPDSYVRLGDLYSQTDNDKAAVRHYSRALELHTGYLEAAVKLGTQHLRMNRFYPAASLFGRAIEINDQLITAYVGLGIAQSSEGRPDQARDTLELAAALEPNTNLLFAEMCRLQLKVALAQSGGRDWDQNGSGPGARTDELALRQLERHKHRLAENPNQADLHYRYGVLLRGRGQTYAAIEEFRQAVRVNHSYLKAQIKLGLALSETGRTDEAMECLTEATCPRPEYIDLHYRLGLLYCDKIRFALAVEHFASEFGDPMNDADVEANLSLALQNMGIIDRAAATWRAICELEPDSTMAFQAQRALQPLKPVC